MDGFEILLFIACLLVTIIFLFKWFKYSFSAFPSKKYGLTKVVFIILPIITLVFFIVILTALASYDVTGIYVTLYILLGYAVIYVSLFLCFLLFNISWIDDAISLNNRAALITISALYISIALIYGGANIGDGPGFWVVLVANGLGTLVWFLLIMLVNAITKINEQITVERNIGSAIRFSSYVVSLAIILGRASSGDWTSFLMTLYEFLVGWPALILTAIVVISELIFKQGKSMVNNSSVLLSVALGVVYLGFAISSLFLVPALQ